MNKNAISVIFSVLGLITSTAIAGDIRGTFYDKNVLGVGDVTKYDLKLEKDVVTKITIIGDGNGDIDCWLSDENNNVVIQDTDKMDTCYIKINPLLTGPFTLKVINSGKNASVFEITVN
jgi:hypothetical protein